jgi:aminoglycoside 6'-N-acetyltransferase I
MSGLFAEYTPRSASSVRSGPPGGLETRELQAADLDEVAAIRSERDGRGLGPALVWARSSLARRAAAPGSLEIVVARRGDAALGYGCVVRISPTESAPPNAIPAGLYLGGVVVRPQHRRQGIASALTAWRMEWIYARADRAHYFANSLNRASHDLHVAFGFTEVRRGIWAPGVRFEGGEGVLYRAERPGDEARRVTAFRVS